MLNMLKVEGDKMASDVLELLLVPFLRTTGAGGISDGWCVETVLICGMPGQSCEVFCSEYGTRSDLVSDAHMWF